MASRKLVVVLITFSHTIEDSKQLAADAHSWSLPGAGAAPPLISPQRRDYFAEMAFLRAFSAWETFLEESFLLYLLGYKAPRGRAPHRYAFPPDPTHAMNWLTDGREYATWTDAGYVGSRAKRFFSAGRPFADVLSRNQNLLREVNTIRNAIAHRSGTARQKFEEVVRQKLGTAPPNLTVGSFLGTTAPRIIPPSSFLEFYISKIEFAARQIVPT